MDADPLKSMTAIHPWPSGTQLNKYFSCSEMHIGVKGPRRDGGFRRHTVLGDWQAIATEDIIHATDAKIHTYLYWSSSLLLQTLNVLSTPTDPQCSVHPYRPSMFCPSPWDRGNIHITDGAKYLFLWKRSYSIVTICELNKF